MSVGVRCTLRKSHGHSRHLGSQRSDLDSGIRSESLENRFKQADKPLRDQLGGQAGAQTTGSELADLRQLPESCRKKEWVWWC